MLQTAEPAHPRPGRAREASTLEPGGRGRSHTGHVGAWHLKEAAAEQLSLAGQPGTLVFNLRAVGRPLKDPKVPARVERDGQEVLEVDG